MAASRAKDGRSVAREHSIGLQVLDVNALQRVLLADLVEVFLAFQIKFILLKLRLGLLLETRAEHLSILLAIVAVGRVSAPVNP